MNDDNYMIVSRYKEYIICRSRKAFGMIFSFLKYQKYFKHFTIIFFLEYDKKMHIGIIVNDTLNYFGNNA